MSSSDKEPVQQEHKHATLQEGALLYDNWPKLNKVKIEKKHVLSTTDTDMTTNDTWRCATCHGWDYLGNANSVSVAGNRKTSIDDLSATLKDSRRNHDFSRYLSEKQIGAVSRFIREGIFNVNEVLTQDGSCRGNVSQGRKQYQRFCVKCHGQDGNGIKIGNKENAYGINSIARDNPGKTLHKTIWGNPGTDMPSLFVENRGDISAAVDILAYLQHME